MKAPGPRTVTAISQPYYDQIANGYYPKLKPWSKTGYNAAVGGTSETLWVLGGNYVWPATAGIQMQVSTTGAQDTAAGTGVQQVRIGYLDNNYVEQSEIVTLNGVVMPVPTVAVNIARVQNFRAYRVGANAVAAGNISLQAWGGGVTYSYIAQGYTRARNSVWTVPAGKKLHITSMALASASTAGGRYAVLTTRATYDDATSAVLTAGSFFMPYHEIQLLNGSFYRALEIPTIFPATVDIKVDGVSTGGDVACSSVLRGYLETL